MRYYSFLCAFYYCVYLWQCFSSHVDSFVRYLLSFLFFPDSQYSSRWTRGLVTISMLFLMHNPIAWGGNQEREENYFCPSFSPSFNHGIFPPRTVSSTSTFATFPSTKIFFILHSFLYPKIYMLHFSSEDLHASICYAHSFQPWIFYKWTFS